MRLSLKSLFSILAFISALASTTFSVQADRLSDYWQEQRELYNALADSACAGDRDALLYLVSDAEEEIPAAEALLGWVLREASGCLDLVPNDEFWLYYTREAAISGYPPAMSNWGTILVRGDLGPTRDLVEGLYWLDVASGEGFAAASQFLALTYAEGRHGVEQNLELAQRFYQQAVVNGLPQDEQTAIAETIQQERGSLSERGISETSASLDMPQSSAPIPVGPEGIYQVAVISTSNYSAEGNVRGVPRLGDRQPMGSNYALRVVYVAQAFGREVTGCWVPQDMFMVGWAYVDRNQYAQQTIDRLLESSDQARASGDHRNAQNFRQLPDGIYYVTENYWRVDVTQRPFMWSLVEANAYGPQCDNSYDDVYYPAAVFGPE